MGTHETIPIGKEPLLRRIVGTVAAALLSLTALDAAAATIGFDCITNSSATDCGIGEAQLKLDITDEGAGKVRFTFRQTGPAQAVISEIYFDDGALLGIASIVNGTGVSFVQGANPPNLPGANLASPPFEVTAGFLAEAIPSPSMNGVGKGEQVAIIFNLKNGATFNDVLSQFGDGTVRAGVHVISFASGGSESFVNNPLPEPMTGLLVLVGAAALAGFRRTRPIG
jgi:hypothetical protein